MVLIDTLMVNPRVCSLTICMSVNSRITSIEREMRGEAEKRKDNLYSIPTRSASFALRCLTSPDEEKSNEFWNQSIRSELPTRYNLREFRVRIHRDTIQDKLTDHFMKKSQDPKSTNVRPCRLQLITLVMREYSRETFD